MEPAETRRIDDFLRHLEIERRLSPHTLANYRRDLQDAQAHLDTHGIETWRAVDAHVLRGFVAARHRAGLNGRSIQRRLSALRAFYRYLVREGVVGANPATGIRPPKSPRRLPKTLDVDQVSRLLSVPADEAEPELAQRDHALMELLYSSGLRLAELVRLDLHDLDLADRSVRVTGKGNKTRIVPVGEPARAALGAWLQRRGEFAARDEQALFVGRRGRRLSARAVQQRLRRWGIKQGLDRPLHPHMLRHSCASHVLESSGDLRAVQELLGHADISTTQIYTHLDFQHLAKVYDQAHPRAKKRRKNDV